MRLNWQVGANARVGAYRKISRKFQAHSIGGVSVMGDYRGGPRSGVARPDVAINAKIAIGGSFSEELDKGAGLQQEVERVHPVFGNECLAVGGLLARGWISAGRPSARRCSGAAQRGAVGKAELADPKGPKGDG